MRSIAAISPVDPSRLRASGIDDTSCLRSIAPGHQRPDDERNRKGDA